MTTIILQTRWDVSLMGRATNELCRTEPPASRVLPNRLEWWPKHDRWLVPWQTHPWLFVPCRAWTEPNFTYRVLTHLIRPGSTGLIGDLLCRDERTMHLLLY
jgi:hypothetical protein